MAPMADEVDRLRAVEAEQAARIASLKAEIGKWAVAYNELQERLTQVSLWAKLNPTETT